MSATYYEVGFLLAIGGLLLVLEGATTGMAKTATKFLPEWAIKLIAGVVIAVWGLWIRFAGPYAPGI